MIQKLAEDSCILAAEGKAELENRIIPFWRKLKDREHGGYYGYVDFELNIDRQHDKGSILNSRILWFFSNAFGVLKQPVLLDEAEHAYHFLKQSCLDREYGGIYWSAAFTGEPSDCSKHTYSQAFAIYALSSYYEVSGDSEALQSALELFTCIEEKCRDEYGYMEAFTRMWQPVSNEKLSENGLLAEKTMNTILHIVEAYTELYRVSRERKVKEALIWALDIFRDHIFNAEKKQLEVFFNEKMKTISDLYSYGHDIEASWLLDRACEVIGDHELAEQTSDYTSILSEQVYELALDDSGAVNNECFCGTVDRTKVWWVQAESMVGFYNQYEKTKDAKYLEAVIRIWKYIKTYLIDPRDGSEWFWDVNRLGSPVSKKAVAEPWKCPYHNGRMCLEIIRRIG